METKRLPVWFRTSPINSGGLKVSPTRRSPDSESIYRDIEVVDGKIVSVIQEGTETQLFLYLKPRSVLN